MKKLLFAALALPVMAFGQEEGDLTSLNQLPNEGFQGPWVECVPWTSGDNTTPLGIQPEGWHAANVIGIGGLGATQVADSIGGFESTSAVKLTNRANSIMPNQIVPGYLTLGTPWNTSVMGSKNDGGTFGGIDFVGRPDALSFMYRRAYGEYVEGQDNTIESTYNDAEPFNVIAYSWIGSTSQPDVPGNIVIFGNPAKVTMVNRDRNILGIDTYFGGEVTYSPDFQLVNSLNDSIEGAQAEWARRTLPFTYTAPGLFPEKFNVVFAAGNYFANEGIGCNNSLDIDDVRLVYYSQLSSIKLFGEEIKGFSPDTYTYDVTVDDIDDAQFEIEATKLGYAAKVRENGTTNGDGTTGEYTFVVTNPDGVDLAGVNTHTYTVNFATPTTGLETLNADGAEAPVEYFNLQGIRIPAPAAGVPCLRRQGAKLEKVIL